MRYLHLVANAFIKSQAYQMIKAWNKYFDRRVPVVTYHRVCDIDNTYPFDVNLVSASTAAFKQQMLYFKKHFTPITLQQYQNYFINGDSLPSNPVLITFDDGFSDNYDNAFPILKTLAIPATIFITTSFIESNEIIWYEKLAYFCKNTQQPSIEIPQIDFYTKLPESVELRQLIYQKIIELLKSVDNNIRLEALSSLYTRYGNPLEEANEEILKLSRSMSWEQIKEMKKSNIQFGSHSVTHPVLTRLQPDELHYELIESKKTIEKYLGTEISSIAYPVGQKSDYSEKVIDMAKQCGYQLGFSFVDGISNRSEHSRFCIHRLHADIHDPFDLLKAKLYLPSIFCE